MSVRRVYRAKTFLAWRDMKPGDKPEDEVQDWSFILNETASHEEILEDFAQFLKDTRPQKCAGG